MYKGSPTKKCRLCGKATKLTQLVKNKRLKYGRDTICKKCDSARLTTLYRNNPTRKNKVLATYKDRRKKRLEFVANIKLASGCVDCGYKEHHAALQFDHIIGEKIAPLSLMAKQAWSETRILEEIKKCEIVCANCHSIRTYNRAQEKKI